MKDGAWLRVWGVVPSLAAPPSPSVIHVKRPSTLAFAPGSALILALALTFGYLDLAQWMAIRTGMRVWMKQKVLVGREDCG